MRKRRKNEIVLNKMFSAKQITENSDDGQFIGNKRFQKLSF